MTSLLGSSVEAKEKSQILLCGCSKHFDVMLGLFLEQYSCIRKEELLIVSDEDKAFLCSARNVVPQASQQVCLSQDEEL